MAEDPLHHEHQEKPGAVAPSEAMSQGEAWERDFQELRERLLAMREEMRRSAPQDPGFDYDIGVKGRDVDPGFAWRGASGDSEDVDPGFARTPGEIFGAAEFSREIESFCRKYGLTPPPFVNVEYTLDEIAAERDRLL